MMRQQAVAYLVLQSQQFPAKQRYQARPEPEEPLGERSVCHPSGPGVWGKRKLLTRYYTQWNRCCVHQIEFGRPE